MRSSRDRRARLNVLDSAGRVLALELSPQQPGAEAPVAAVIPPVTPVIAPVLPPVTPVIAAVLAAVMTPHGAK